MSGNNLSGKDEFDEQLRMQELYGDPKNDDTQNDSGETDSLGQLPDDTPYEWDLDKKAWFPKITEDFIATYQANYGFSNNCVSSSTANVQDTNMKTVEEPQREIPEATDSKKRGEKRKADSGWFQVEEDRNTNVYVSGLPPDITVDEFIQLMSKFGIIMRDPQTEEFKVKLYRDNQGNLKGDGLCCYLKKESVELALKLLDEDEIRGYKLHVEVAKFQLKGEYDASKKKKKCKDYKKKLSLQQKQLDWRPERRAGSCRMRQERVVIIRNVFHPTDFEDDPLVLNEIREDLRVECSKFGQIRKLLLFDRHPDGVASVSFREPEEADYCIQTLDGRWFSGRQITAQAWDGTTDYQVEETSREREERLRGWETFLSAPEANRGLQRMDSICVSEKAGPSTGRHISEHLNMSNTGAQEAITGMAFEESINENKFEKAEDGKEFEGNASEKDAKEGRSDADDPERESEEGCAKRESGEDLPESELEEGNPKKESQECGPERVSKKKGKNNYEKNGLAKGSEDSDHSKGTEGADSLQKESEDDGSASEEFCSEKQSEDGSDEDFEENGVKNAFDQDASNKEFPENVEKESEENNRAKSEFEEGFERVVGEQGSEREFDEALDDKEEEDRKEAVVFERVFENESDENDNDIEADKKKCGDADGKGEEDDGDEKLFNDPDEKEEEQDTDVKADEDTNDKLFDDTSSKKFFVEEEGLNEKLFDDSDERGAVGNVKEDGSQSTDSSFALGSDDDDEI
ncbi:hypothetical protein U0070_017772 [Myodes glareolus]|uniref:17S U2 SnRNP complex component HTATSF1 n=1 Tax=Myodes glareolus TaxID=447135 RepID=A0AAW0HQ90_MYOGA